MLFAKPGVYPAIVRIGNSDSKVNSDFKADVRSLSFSVDLTRDGSAVPADNIIRQDLSMQNTTTRSFNDAHAFLAAMKMLTASSPAAGLWALSFKGKLRVFRTLALVAVQSHQKIARYQKLRYGSNVPQPKCRPGPAVSVTPDPTRPMSTWRTAWRNLAKQTGLPGLRFHDLRHHAITESAESSASDQTIMAIAGHVSPTMLAHYSHVRLDAKRHALDALSRRTERGVTSQTTSQKEQPKPQLLDLVVDVTGIEPVTPCLQTSVAVLRLFGINNLRSV
jgi:hypothetical protein